MLLGQLARIEHSSAIGRSKNYARLLKFLVDRSVVALKERGKNYTPPKEIEIAVEVFDKGPQYNPADDSFVRVYISNLRKKLETFYANEGINETFRISIPPGGYALFFSQVEISPPQADLDQDNQLGESKTKQKVPTYILILVFVALLSLIANVWLLNSGPSYTEHDVRQHPVWHDLNNNGKPTLIVVGDLYVYRQRDTEIEGRVNIIRNMTINNEFDLFHHIDKHPSKGALINKAHINIFLKGSVFSLKHLMPLFDHKEQISFRVASKLTVDDLKTYNIIYLGLYKSMGMLRSYFQGSNFNLMKRGSLISNKHTNELFKVTGYFESDYNDYGLFAKLDGPNENTIYILSAFSDAAMTAMVKELTTWDRLSTSTETNIVNKNGESSATNFELFYEVASFNRTDLNNKVIFNGKVDDKAVWTEPKKEKPEFK